MAKQLKFFKEESKEFGGSLIKGKRKSARVLDRKKPLHFVLKSKALVNLYTHRKFLSKKLYFYAKRFGIKIYKESVQRDHFHFCIKITNREMYRSFIRAFTGTIARELGKGLWIFRPYSRVVTWGRDFLSVLDYILLNDCEVARIVPYATRKKRRKGPS